MGFQRVVERVLPDGTSGKVYPFHLSLEGMESILLCRDDEDYDHLEKSFYLAALSCNTLVISEIVMSTHGHCAVLAMNWEAASATGEYVKKRHSQYLAGKYGDRHVLARTRISVQYLDSERYVRNALAYIPRNAADTGCRIEDYRWSSYRGVFVGGVCPKGGRAVSVLTRREKEAVFRTHKDLSAVSWILDADGRLEPASACDYKYLESAFGGDQTFFLRMIGDVNPAEMRQKLVLSSRVWQADSEFFVTVSTLADKWYRRPVSELTRPEKSRLITYLYRSYCTSVAQLARCLRLPKEDVMTVLRDNGIQLKNSPATAWRPSGSGE